MKHEMTAEQADRSAHELAEKLRTVVKEHFGNEAFSGSYEESVSNTFILAMATGMLSAETVVEFSKRASEYKASYIEEELHTTEQLFIGMLLSQIDLEILDSLGNMVGEKTYN